MLTLIMQIEDWVERHIGAHLERWGKRFAGSTQGLRPEQDLPE